MEFDDVEYSFPKTEQEIINKYIKLKKIARRYWNIASLSFTYCLSYSIFHFFMKEKLRNGWMIFSSLTAVLLISPHFEAFFVRRFNKKDFNTFKTYCLKYEILDEYIL